MCHRKQKTAGVKSASQVQLRDGIGIFQVNQRKLNKLCIHYVWMGFKDLNKSRILYFGTVALLRKIYRGVPAFFQKSISFGLPLTYRFVYIRVSGKFVYLTPNNSRFHASVSMTKRELKVFSVLLTLCIEMKICIDFFFTLKMAFQI